MRRFSFSERLRPLVIAGLIGVVVPVGGVPSSSAALVGGDEYEVAKISESFLLENISIVDVPPQMEYQSADKELSHFLHRAFAIENVGMKFRLSREECGSASCPDALKMKGKVKVVWDIRGAYLAFRQYADIVRWRLTTIDNRWTKFEANIFALPTIASCIYGDVGPHLPHPEISLIFDNSFVCYHGLSNADGDIFHSVGRSNCLSNRFSHVFALLAHVPDGLSQAESLTPEYRGLQKKDQGGDDTDPDGPPISHFAASPILIVVGCALVFWSVEHIGLENDRLRMQITQTGYELPNFATRSRRQTFAIGTAPPLTATHQTVDLMEA
jgi:hypothetical protein